MDRRLFDSLSPLLDQVLDLHSDARPAFLASLRSVDPTVATTLEALLAENERVLASGFLDASPLTAVDLPRSLLSRSVGAYTLERPLGAGGMGTVWLGRRSDGRFEGQAAIKLINLSVLDPVARERFAREGSLLARLAHPNIARLFDAGITAAAQPFLVLEYVNGTRIDEHADGRQLDVRGRLELFLQVADAVAHAHANLVVHRDLKPSNILVDDSGRVKLLDFGIAKLIRDDAATRVITALPALTIRYAAPEQVNDEPVSTASDVYALGVLLYELLGGSHPTIRAEGDAAAQLRALTEREPLRLSDAVRMVGDPVAAARIAGARATSPDRLHRAYRGDLDVILGKALKKRPEERYGTVTAFADDVRRHLRNEPVTARKDSLPYRVRKFTMRHRLGLAAAASVIAALVAGTAIAVVQARESARQRDRALTDLRLAEAKNDFGDLLLSLAAPNGKPISNAELLARGEALIPKRFANDAPLRVHMLLSLADRYHDNLQFDARNRVLAQAYADSRSIADVGLKSLATCRMASQFAEGGDFGRAFSMIDDVLPILSANSDYVATESRCRVFEATFAVQNRDAARAIPAAERAVFLEEHRGGAPGRLFEPLAALASAYAVGSRWDAASRTFARSLAALESDGLGDTRTAAVVLNNWAVMLQDAGQVADGARLAARAVDVARGADSENGPNLGILSTYGSLVAGVGDYAAADRILEESLGKARLAGSPRRLVIVLQFAIRSACDAGDGARAARLLTEAYDVLKADPSPTDYSKAAVEISAARVALAGADAARAAELAGHAVEMFATATPTRAGIMQAEIFHARSLNASGRFSEAAAVADRSVRDAKDRLGDLPHSSFLGQALLELATAKSAMGDAAAARDAITSALENLHASVGAGAAEVQRAESLTAKSPRE